MLSIAALPGLLAALDGSMPVIWPLILPGMLLPMSFSASIVAAPRLPATLAAADDMILASPGSSRSVPCSFLPFSMSLVVHLARNLDRKSTRLNSSHVKISYAVFCLKKKKNQAQREHRHSRNVHDH